MGQPFQKRNEMREVRIVIKTVLLASPCGLCVRDLTPKVREIAPYVTAEQIKRQAFKMAMPGGDLEADMSNPRRAVYYLAGSAIEPPEPEHVKYKQHADRAPDLEKEVMPVKQRTVPAAAGLFTAGRRTPMEWCVDVMELMGAEVL